MTTTAPRTLPSRLAPAGRRPADRGLAPVLRHVDPVLVAAVAGLLAVGSLLVWSATASRPDPTALVQRHLVTAAVGVAVGAAVARGGLQRVSLWGPLVYAAALLGLLGVLTPLGRTVNGARSWLSLGGLQVQPGELAKLATVLAVAWVLSRGQRLRPGEQQGLAELLPALAVAGLPAALVLAQPDLGTVLVLLGTVLGLLAVGGVRVRWLAALLGAGVAVVVVALRRGVLDSYQLARFAAFADPGLDPRGVGYNVNQARIAIGNGGLSGTGLFEGTQTSGRFVPEQHTDFVFTVAGEELGFLGAGLLVVLLGVVLWRGLRIAAAASTPFGGLAAAGVVCWWGFQSFVNVGMCLGIMPVTGLPLPFVSYGGSAMVADLAALGLLLAVHASARRRPR